jgi:hypothetical protein
VALKPAAAGPNPVAAWTVPRAVPRVDTKRKRDASPPAGAVLTPHAIPLSTFPAEIEPPSSFISLCVPLKSSSGLRVSRGVERRLFDQSGTYVSEPKHQLYPYWCTWQCQSLSPAHHGTYISTRAYTC